MKHFFKGVLLTSGLLVSSLSAAITLPEVVQHTVSTNPTVRLSEHVRESAQEGVRVARAGFFPSVDLNAGLGPENTKSPSTLFITRRLSRKELGANLRQMLFDAFGTLNDVRHAKYITNADAYAVLGQANDQAILAIEAYLNILQDRRLVSIAQDNLARVSRIFELVKQRTSAGLGRKADIYQGRSRVELAKANLYALRNEYLDSLAAFRKVTGMDPKNLTPPKNVPDRNLATSLQVSIERSIGQNPKLKSALADVAEAQYHYKSSRAVNWPRLDLEAGVNRDTNIDGLRGGNNDAFAMFRMKFNIFRGFGDVSKQRENAYAVDQAADIRNRTLRQLIESVRFAWYSWRAGLKRIPALTARRTATFGTVRVYKEQFKLGRRTLLDLLDTENELFVSRIEYVREFYLLAVSKYRLLADMNVLLPYLHVVAPAASLVPYKENLVIPFVDPDEGMVSSDSKYRTVLNKAEVESRRDTGHRLDVLDMRKKGHHFVPPGAKLRPLSRRSRHHHHHPRRHHHHKRYLPPIKHAKAKVMSKSHG